MSFVSGSISTLNLADQFRVHDAVTTLKEVCDALVCRYLVMIDAPYIVARGQEIPDYAPAVVNTICLSGAAA